ncbi:PucR family transcriptional regulator [Lachnospiraceae bacterium 54-53]
MYMTLKEFMSFPELNGARLLTGSASPDHMIRWYHIIEIEELGNWIEPNILVFITGVAFKDKQKSLKNIVSLLSRHHAAGLVISLGSYISDISQEVLDEADRLHFPIIIISEKIKLVNLTYCLGQYIFQKQIQEKNLKILMKNILNDTISPNEDSRLEAYGYKNDYNYFVCTFSFHSSGEYGSIPDFNYLYNQFIKTESAYNRKFLTLEDGNQYISLMPLKPGEPISVIADICHFLSGSIADAYPGFVIRIGISRMFLNTSSISTEYSNSLFALKVASCLPGAINIISYQDCSFLRLINFQNTGEIQLIVQDYLGDIILHPDLLLTLQTFLMNGLSIKQTAEALYIHVNSLKYRLGKIYQLLPVSLKGDGWYKVQTAIYLHSYSGLLQ